MTVPLSHEQRVDVILDYRNRYNLNVFIESGTAECFTLSRVVGHFREAHSIELYEPYYEGARAVFSDEESVHLHLGDSAQVLPGIVDKLTEPALFWLDGHYCGGPEGSRASIDTPIEAELQAAVTAPWGSVILVDDARLFGGGDEHTEEFKDYPDTTWVFDVAASNGFNFELVDDIMRLTPL